MKFLIDTECWLWGLAEPERLFSKARELMIDRENEVYLSAVSSFEMAFKVAIGKLALPEPPSGLRSEAHGVAKHQIASNRARTRSARIFAATSS